MSDEVAVDVTAGEAAQAAVSPEVAQEQSNPFDFTGAADDVAEVAESDGAEGGDESAPYALDLADSAYAGDEDWTSFLTSKAQESGLSAEGASAFVKEVCGRLRAEQDRMFTEGTQALQDLWRGNYESNLKATGKFLNDYAKAAGLSEAECGALMNPAVFKLANTMRRNLSGSASKGTSSGASMTKQQRFDALMADPAKVAILHNPMHAEYRKVAAEANSYLPSGMTLF